MFILQYLINNMQDINQLITYPITLESFKQITNSYLREYETLLFNTFIIKMVEIITAVIITNGLNYIYITEINYITIIHNFQYITKDFPNNIFRNTEIIYSFITNLMIDVCNKIQEKFIGIKYNIKHKDKISFVWK